MEKEIQFKKVGQLKNGNYLLIDDIPCKMKDMATAKGKHGAAKARINAVGVFDGQKRMEIRTSSLANDLQKSGELGKNWEKILSNLPRLSNRMVYSRIFSQSSAV